MSQKPFFVEMKTGQTVVGLIVSILLLVGLFMLARFVFKILFYLSPFLLIATLILDYRTVTGYLKWVKDLFQRNPMYGVGISLFSVLGFPVLATGLFLKALFVRRYLKATGQDSRNRNHRKEETFVPFEEIEDEELTDQAPIKLPRFLDRD